MRLIDRYLLTEWAKAFAMALLVTLGILLIEDLQDDLPDFLDYGASTTQILKYYLFLTPTFLPVIVPVAFLASLLFALGNLHRHNEIIALRASGQALPVMTRSLLAAGMVLTLLAFYLNATLVPEAIEQTRTMRLNWKFSSEARHKSKDHIGIIKTLTFDNRRDGRLWIMNRFSEYILQGYGVTVYQLDHFGNEQTRILAAEAYFDNLDHHWVMRQGRQLDFEPTTGEILRSVPFEEKAFPSFKESPELMKLFGKDPRELSLREVRHLLTTAPPQQNPHMTPYLVRYYGILANPFTCLIAAAIGIPFAVAGVRTNPMVNVSKAASLFLVYFLLSALCGMLGKQGILPPIVTAWLPHGLILALSIVYWRKTR